MDWEESFNSHHDSNPRYFSLFDVAYIRGNNTCLRLSTRDMILTSHYT